MMTGKMVLLVGKHYAENNMASKHKAILPDSYIKDDELFIYYRPRPGNVKKHCYVNDEDEGYCYQILQRLLAEICEKQFIEPELYNSGALKESKFSISAYKAGITPKPNSIISYTAGLLNNRYRNGKQDFTVKQLAKVELLTAIANNLYATEVCEVGYNIQTGKKNKLPYKVKFVEA